MTLLANKARQRNREVAEIRTHIDADIAGAHDPAQKPDAVVNRGVQTNPVRREKPGGQDAKRRLDREYALQRTPQEGQGASQQQGEYARGDRM
ncbi:MAG: hypothetical protein AAGF99_10785 [Bacteroidota bacterium]